MDDFILAPDFANGRIYQIAMADANINALDIGVVQSPLSIVYDPNTTFIYWTDITDGHVMRSTLDGTNFMDVFTSIGKHCCIILWTSLPFVGSIIHINEKSHATGTFLL